MLFIILLILSVLYAILRRVKYIPLMFLPKGYFNTLINLKVIIIKALLYIKGMV